MKSRGIMSQNNALCIFTLLGTAGTQESGILHHNSRDKYIPVGYISDIWGEGVCSLFLPHHFKFQY
jgi:hypothetical protein